MKRRWLILLMALALAVLIGGTVAVAAVASDDGPAPAVVVEDEGADDSSEDAAEGPDVPITGPDLERASQAALDYLGEGRVTETEIEDEESYYEVEVTLDDGRQIDVQLDEAFNVVGTD